MKKFVLIFSVFLLVVFLSSCKGQDQSNSPKGGQNQFEGSFFDGISTITEADTLTIPHAPHRIIRNIKIDQEGNLLIAAYVDVIRYDGESFTNLPKQKGLESYDAFDVLEDKNGNTWIASTHLGVFRHDGKSLTQFTTDDGLVHNRTMCIYEDRAGNIWIGTQGGASCYTGKSFRNFSVNEGLTHNDVNTIMEDKTGKIWLGTRGNACVYDPSAEQAFTEMRNDQDIPFTNLWSIIEDKRGDIWMGGEEGLWRYNGAVFTKLATESISYVYEDQKGNIWTTSSVGILTRYDSTSLLNEQPTGIHIFEGGSMFFGISEDKEGNIWVGTLKGVYRYDGNIINYFKD